MSPPAAAFPDPTFKLTSPPLPFVALPVPIQIVPLVPSEVVPVLKLRDPLAPADPPSDVITYNAPLVLDMRWPSGNATTSKGQSHSPGEMITPEQVGWGMAGMVMFDGHTLPSGIQPLVFDRTTHGLTPDWQN